MIAKGGKKKSVRIGYDTVVGLAAAMPEVDESTSYGTPALKVRGKMFVRLKEDGETIVLKTDFLERDLLMRVDPETFFITDHYRDYGWVLVRLSSVGRERMAELLESAWRRVAPESVIAKFDGAV